MFLRPHTILITNVYEGQEMIEDNSFRMKNKQIQQQSSNHLQEISKDSANKKGRIIKVTL
jgi:hypothetical protein